MNRFHDIGISARLDRQRSFLRMDRHWQPLDVWRTADPDEKGKALTHWQRKSFVSARKAI